jgi:hypothetical protein
VQLLENFPAFYGTRRFITAFIVRLILGRDMGNPLLHHFQISTGITQPATFYPILINRKNRLFSSSRNDQSVLSSEKS